MNKEGLSIMKKILLSIFVVFLLTSFYPKNKLPGLPLVIPSLTSTIHIDETGNRISKGYMTRVVEQLPNVQFVNQGHNGWTSGGIARRI
jgi:hypothetical protein